MKSRSARATGLVAAAVIAAVVSVGALVSAQAQPAPRPGGGPGPTGNAALFPLLDASQDGVLTREAEGRLRRVVHEVGQRRRQCRGF
jgi:hypothetical protein